MLFSGRADNDALNRNIGELDGQDSGIPKGLPSTKTIASGRLQTRVNEWLTSMGATDGARFEEIRRHDLPDALDHALAALEEATGIKVHVVRNLTPEIQRFNGITFGGGRVYVSEDAEAPAVTVAAHEFTHILQHSHPALYQQLEDEVRRQGRLGDWEAELRWRSRGEAVDRDVAAQGLTANTVGDALSDPEFLQRMAERSPGRFRVLVQRFLDYLNSLIGRVRSLGSAQYLTDVQRFRDTLADALAAYAQTPISIRIPAGKVAFNRQVEDDAQVRSLVEQYANVKGAPSEAEIREAVRQFRDTERAYGGKPAYEKAKAAGRMKLSYDTMGADPDAELQAVVWGLGSGAHARAAGRDGTGCGSCAGRMARAIA